MRCAAKSEVWGVASHIRTRARITRAQAKTLNTKKAKAAGCALPGIYHLGHALNAT